METLSGCFPEDFPHSSFADAVNSNIVESEIFGGVALRDLSVGAELEVLTENRCYLLTYCGADTAYISGHPVFCPQPVLVRIHGSTWGGAMRTNRSQSKSLALPECGNRSMKRT